MEISIIVPTYNRKDILLRCLANLENQNYPLDRFEVLVIDDGSDDGTNSSVKNFKRKTKLNIRYFRIKKSGPAAARNFALGKIRGTVIFLLNDDTYPTKFWLKEHMKTHHEHDNVAVLGPIEWYPKAEISEFMQFMSSYGLVFDTFRIKDPNNCGFRYFFSSNISLNKNWFKKAIFDEVFKDASAEDIEIGCRLEKHGLRIVFNKKAIVHHDHYQREDNFYKRLYKIGKYWNILEKLHPEEFQINRVALLKLVASRFYFLLIFNKNLYWKFKCSLFYYLGMFDWYTKKDYLTSLIYKLLRATL